MFKLKEVLELVDLESKKVLFVDVDGTLGQTMDAHNKAYELAFNLNSVPFNLENHKTFAPLGGEILMQKTVIDIGFSKEVADKIVKDKQTLLPICLDNFMEHNTELIDLIKEMDEEGIPTVIVSNGRKKSVTQILERTGLFWRVSGIICKEDYENAKPNPDPYLAALKLMNVEPHEVLVFEDNQIGIDSALAAGIEDIVEVFYTEEEEDEI